MDKSCRVTAGEGGCQSRLSSSQSDPVRVGKISSQLRRVLGAQGARIRAVLVIEFAASLDLATKRAEQKRRLLRASAKLSRSDILTLIGDAQQTGDEDEVLWRCFLAGHFGRTSTNSRRETDSAARLLCAFGDKPYWTWERVATRQVALREWLQAHKVELRSLRYGNHRKYESKRPKDLYRVFESFSEWIEEHGGSPAKAFRIDREASPETRFDTLYRSLKKGVHRFGRTGAFDLLCLLHDLGVLQLRAGSCYLSGSTGPLAGARKLWGKRRPSPLSQLADRAAIALGIPFDVFEDALCTWQK
jgi:Alpha-glutamyl/putrescinyl thymine pyrophosphorylase clade 3